MKDFSAFHSGKSRCKDCRRAEMAEAYRKNPEPVKQRARKWFQENRDRQYEWKLQKRKKLASFRNA